MRPRRFVRNTLPALLALFPAVAFGSRFPVTPQRIEPPVARASELT